MLNVRPVCGFTLIELLVVDLRSNVQSLIDCSGGSYYYVWYYTWTDLFNKAGL